MCGIAGAIGNFSPSVAKEAVNAMVAALGHRGPDQDGAYSWSTGPHTVALGHTRLSILDLSEAGRQPMTDSRGKLWTVFNGEIYNFKELRSILDPERLLFRTETDTEAILYGYHRWSVESFRRLRGMFAFGLLDQDRRALHLVRDPLGIKPLYYYRFADGLLFASEVRALLATGMVPRRLNASAVHDYLSSGSLAGSRTAIAGVKMLQPGQVLTVSLGGSELKSVCSTYEDLLPAQDIHPGMPEKERNTATGHMLHLLRESVKAHLVSDVPVGLFLSGGIDSTALLHLMHQARPSSLKTFTVVFPETQFSEGKFATQVAAQYGAEHLELEIAQPDLLRQLPAALSAMDQPTMDGINTFTIANAVRSAGVKVALSGLGADELFGGYPSFRRARWAQRAAAIPTHIRRAAAGIGQAATRSFGYDKLWELLRTDCTSQAAYRLSRQLFNAQEISSLLPGVPGTVNPTQPYSSTDAVNDVSRLELRGYMTDLLLRDTDFMSMASSLEVRVPFIDKVVMRHALQMPGKWKIEGPGPKPLLRDSMRGAIPRYVWDRRKMGFVFPFDSWMRSTLRPEMEGTLCLSKTTERLGLSGASASGMWHGFLNGSLRWSKPWSLFVLLRWCERHGVSV